MTVSSDPGAPGVKRQEMLTEEQWAPCYDRVHLGTFFLRMLYRDLARRINGILVGNLLEVGCGTGILLDMTKECDKCGVDFSANMLRHCAKTVARIRADIDFLPFRNRCFKTAFIHGVLHHKEEILPTLLELNRVLADGAKVLTQEPSATTDIGHRFLNRMLCKFFVLLGTSMYEKPREIDELRTPATHRLFRMEELTGAAMEAGFEVESARYMYSTSYVLSCFKGRLPIYVGRFLDKIMCQREGYVIRTITIRRALPIPHMISNQDRAYSTEKVGTSVLPRTKQMRDN